MPCPHCDGTNKVGEHDLSCSYCMGTDEPVSCYAGIGSRETPEPVLKSMETIAALLALKGWVLRSGRAKGADRAFEAGCESVQGRKVIRIATRFGAAMQHASLFHPNWDACDVHARALHARNSLIMVGDWLDHPVKFVVCWTPGGAVTGGTGQALRIAEALSIPVFNLAIDGHEQHLINWINS